MNAILIAMIITGILSVFLPWLLAEWTLKEDEKERKERERK